jgi:hypothetical protein
MYRTVFNGTRMVYRKVEKQKGRGVVATVVQEAPVEEKVAATPAPIEKPEDKKARRLKYAAEIMKIM